MNFYLILIFGRTVKSNRIIAFCCNQRLSKFLDTNNTLQAIEVHCFFCTNKGELIGHKHKLTLIIFKLMHIHTQHITYLFIRAKKSTYKMYMRHNKIFINKISIKFFLLYSKS